MLDIDPETGKVVDIELVSKDLTSKLQDIRDQQFLQWSKLIANPHGYAAESIDVFRSGVVMAAAVMMEHDVKVEVPKKERKAEDVVKESMAELGMMLGAKGFAGALSFWRRVKDDMMDHSSSYDEEMLEIYEDEDEDGEPTGTYFFVDPSTGEQVPCTIEGEELWEE